MRNAAGALGWVESQVDFARRFACAGLGLAAFVFYHPVVLAQEPKAPAAAEESSQGPVDSGSTLTCSVYPAVFTDALPIIGHQYQDTLVLAPGAADLDGDGNPVVHGSRETSVRYAFDGGDTSDPATGGFGQNLDPLAIDSVKLITAGAPAEYGRAMGGFADVTTRSGGNDFAGRLWILWRGSFLDGDGADNEDFIPFDDSELEWNDLRVAASAGGAFVRDRFWYFATLQSLDTEQPTSSLGPDTLIESHGWFGLGKLTFQASPMHRIDLQVSADPLEVSGLGIESFTSPESGFDQDQGGVVTQLRWTGILTNDLMVEAGLIHLDTDLMITPTSAFEEMQVMFSQSFFSPGELVATYPCASFNCALGDDIFRIDEFGQVSGTYPFLIDREATRDLLRASLTIDLDDHLGDHRFRMGFEAGKEELHEELTANPILIDLTEPFQSPFPGPVNPFAIQGVQIVQAPQLAHVDGTVNNFTMGAWLSDAWKVLPGLSINAGIRYDSDEIDAPGFRSFDPREERKSAMALWQSVCAEARRQGAVSVFSNCSITQAYDGNPPQIPSGVVDTFLDADMNGVNDVPAEVASLDVNDNGVLDLGGIEGAELFRDFTTGLTRQAERYLLEDSNVSPRIGVSWDPWNDGKTRAFAHWGRYYDRLRPETALVESGPDYLNFTFAPDPSSHLIFPGSESVGSTVPSISQADHDLETPHTDEWSLGFERELGAAWSAGLTFVNRSAEDLLYDRDLNHYTCGLSGEAIGLDPNAICGSPFGLEVDKFGDIAFIGFPGFIQIPNGLEDLYAANPFFGQVHTVTNTSVSEYTAWELEFVRALHRSWQMQLSYTLSRARGEITSVVNGDPSLSGAETGPLDFDQRHVLKLQAAAHLTHGVVLAGILTWATGTPYSIFETTADLDSAANAQARTILPTGGLNDQRNDEAWRLDGRLEKSFTMGRVSAGGFLLVENMLNDDDLVIESAAPGAVALIGERDFGRRFEIGALFTF